jgi:autotransporter-associated beta strand protein
MAKYVLAFHGGGMPETEEEQAQVMAAWGAWYGTLGDAVVDPGNATGSAKTISPDGTVTVGGGPNPLSGYTLIDAGTFDEAVTMAKGCPILEAGGSIEVCETIAM